MRVVLPRLGLIATVFGLLLLGCGESSPRPMTGASSTTEQPGVIVEHPSLPPTSVDINSINSWTRTVEAQSVRVWAGSEPAILATGHVGDSNLTEVYESVQPATNIFATGDVLGGEDGALRIASFSGNILQLTASDQARYSYNVASETLKRLGGPSPPARHPTLLSYGIGSVMFGEVENDAISTLNDLLGAPMVASAMSGIGECQIDHYVNWASATAYFSNQMFVGYSSPPHGPQAPATATLATANGVRVGDTLAQAQKSYGSRLQTSLAQGGSWMVTTSDGYFLEGLLTYEPNQPGQVSRIATIEAGKVGCPAETP